MILQKTQDIEPGKTHYKLLQWVTPQRGARMIFHLATDSPRSAHAKTIVEMRKALREMVAEGVEHDPRGTNVP